MLSNLRRQVTWSFFIFSGDYANHLAYSQLTPPWFGCQSYFPAFDYRLFPDNFSFKGSIKTQIYVSKI